MKSAARRDGRVAEGARLESVYTFTGIGGSNPSLSARFSRRLRVKVSRIPQVFLAGSHSDASLLKAATFLPEAYRETAAPARPLWTYSAASRLEYCQSRTALLRWIRAAAWAT